MDNDDIKFQESGPELNGREQSRGFGDKLADLIVKYSGGSVQNKSQANIIIIIAAVIIFIISMIIFLS